MRPTISPSGLMCFEKCAEAYRQRYILKRRTPPGVNMIRGTAVHAARKVAMEERIKGGQWEPELSREVAYESVNDAFRGEVVLEDEWRDQPQAAQAECEHTALALAEFDAAAVHPLIQPARVEYELTIDPQGWPFALRGYIDLLDKRNWIIDCKTSAKKPPEDVADKSLQLSIYSLMSRFIKEPEKLLMLDYLILTRGGNLTYLPLRTRRTEGDLQVVLNRLTVMCRAIEKGIFLPARPDDWCCNPKWCDCYANCAYATRSRRPIT